MAYLAEVRADVGKLVTALQEEIRGVESPEEVAGIFQEWQKELWEYLEAKLKESYRNGQKAIGGEPPEKPKRRFADWRNKGRESAP